MSRIALLILTLATATVAGCGQAHPDAPSTPVQLVGFTNVAHQHPAVARASAVAEAHSEIAPGSVMRFSLHWRLVQPHPDTPPDFTRYDEDVVRPALERGLRPLVVVTAAPSWAWGDGRCAEVHVQSRGFCVMPPGADASSLDAWREFVRAVADHYGEKAVAIEIWNEPNGGGFWNTTDGPDPAHYADVLCAAHEAVSGVSPDTPVISGGLATSFDTDRDHISSSQFLTELYASRDVRKCMEGIGVHPYPGQTSPSGAGSIFQTRLQEVRAVRNANEDDDPFWITEFGYFTRGPGGISEDQQAEGLVCALKTAGAMGDVEAFVIHTLFDRGTTAAAEDSFGILSLPAQDGDPVPKSAVAELTHAIGAPTSLAENQDC